MPSHGERIVGATRVGSLVHGDGTVEAALTHVALAGDVRRVPMGRSEGDSKRGSEQGSELTGSRRSSSDSGEG